MPLSGSALLFDELTLIVSVIITIIAAYRSLIARRAVIGHFYRSRAFWTAAVSTYLAIFFVYELSGDFGYASPLSATTYSPILSVYYILLFGLGLTVLWVWIASTINVSLDLDFFHRDLLLWKRGMKYVAWGVWLLGVWLPAIPPFGLLTNASPGPAGLVETIFLFAPLAYATIILGLGFTRVRDDLLRGYTKWIGLVVSSTLVSIIVVPYNFPFVFTAYFLYRGAESLSLRNRKDAANS